MLNQDVDFHIFSNLSITGKRTFLRINGSLNKLAIYMPQIEIDFQNMLNDIGFFGNFRYTGLYYSLYKYTAELLYDNQIIPNRYIIVENNILHQFPKICKRLAKNGNNGLIKKILRMNRNGSLYPNSYYVMYGAAKAGNIKMLEWLVQNGYKRKEYATACAAKGNQMETFEWLINNGFAVHRSTIDLAGSNGHTKMLEYLVNKGYPIDSYRAACAGRFEIVKYFHSIDMTSIIGVHAGAIKSGHLEMLKYACQHGSSVNDNDVLCKDIHILSWLIDNNHIKPSEAISENVAHMGNLQCVQLLYHRYPVLTEKVFVKAVSSRNIEMIIWLYELGCPIDNAAISAAIRYPLNRPRECGSLPILKMLVEWKCPVNDGNCATAAFYGDLDILKYLVSIGCNMNADVIENAAYAGHLHTIIWAREQGCQWNARACSATVKGNHLNILKWLRGINRNKCELKSNETEICPWDYLFGSNAIYYNRLDMLKFAKVNGYKVNDAVVRRATERKLTRDRLLGRNN